jgi:hypothetical protein
MKNGLLRIITFIQKKERRIIITLVGGLILLGIAYSIYLGGTLRYPDEQEYYAMATNISRVHAYTLDGQHSTAFRPPGYVFILAFLTLLSPSIIFLRAINFIALGIAMYGLYRILKEHMSPLAGIIGGVLVWSYPVLFYTAGTLYPQTIAATLLVFLVLLAAREIISIRTFVLIGFIFGYIILMIPVLAALLIPLLAWLVFIKKVGKKHVIIFLAITLLTTVPWTIRNYIVFHSFVPFSSNSGMNLLLGNSENTTPNGGVTVDITQYKAGAVGLNEIERDAYYRSQAIEFISNNLVHSSKMYFLKLLNHFNYRNDLRTSSESSRISDFVMLFSYGCILILTVLRIMSFRKYPLSALEMLVLILYIANALINAVFFTRIRFRLPFDLLLIMIVSMFLDYLIRTRILNPGLHRSHRIDSPLPLNRDIHTHHKDGIDSI